MSHFVPALVQNLSFLMLDSFHDGLVSQHWFRTCHFWCWIHFMMAWLAILFQHWSSTGHFWCWIRVYHTYSFLRKPPMSAAKWSGKRDAYVQSSSCQISFWKEVSENMFFFSHLTYISYWQVCDNFFPLQKTSTTWRFYPPRI